MVTTTTNRPASSWSFAELTPAETQYLTHGYHRYPAKFIPQLVRQLVEEYSRQGDRICDPFGGCGTTLVEAKLANRTSFGFDINPVAVMITRTKITAVCPDTLSKRLACLQSELEKSADATEEINLPQNSDRLLYWFGEATLKRLIQIKGLLRKEENASVRRFFFCALSHVLKNCSYWLTTSTKPQKDPDKVPESPDKVFLSHLSRMITRNADFHEEMQKFEPGEPLAFMHKADAQHLPLPANCVDLVVTSPPYSTSYEYPDIHQLTALLFGFCETLNDFREGFIGCKTGNLQRDETPTNSKASKAVGNLRTADTRLGDAVNSYYVDMNHVYNEMHRVLRKGKRACIVIGDTELRGVQIPNTEVAIDQMRKVGFVLEKKIQRPVPGRVLAPYRDKHDGRFTSADNPEAKKIYSHEYILVLRKK